MAHKFHGPRGVGALYCRTGLPLYPLIEGGAQERNRRAGTENVAGICAMAAALEEMVANLDRNAAYVSALRDRLIDGLSAIPHSALNGDRKNRLPGNVNFCFEGIEGESLLLLLDQAGICVSTGSACSSASLEPSHALIGVDRGIGACTAGFLRCGGARQRIYERAEKKIICTNCAKVSHLRQKAL